MNLLREKLDLLEARLTALIEGKLSRWLQSRDQDEDISTLLIQEMRARSTTDQDGSPIAPDAFTVLANPDDPGWWEDVPGFCEHLSAVILQAGEEAGMRFRARPHVKFVPDPALPPGHIRVRAHASGETINETMTMLMNRNQAEETLPTDAFLIVDSTTIFPLDKPVINIGRRPDNHLVIEDERVSRLHAQLRAVKGHYVIFDLGSTGGTYVNGIRQRQCQLFPGDVISLAGVTLVYGQDSGFKPAGNTLNSSSDDGGTQPLTPFPTSE